VLRAVYLRSKKESPSSDLRNGGRKESLAIIRGSDLQLLLNYQDIYFQQGDGPGHKSMAILAYMKRWNLVPIFLLAFSPNLSSIKDIWTV
jgi:hypothetical protein